LATIEAGDLVINYRDEGDVGSPAVLLIHGWPDDATTWDGVVPVIVAAGRRAIVPTLRGFGATRFLSDETPRTGDSAVIAMDMIALLDALGIARVAVIGHDWGSNVAEALAVGWPDRIERIALLSSPPRLGGVPTPPFWHAQREWYHWFMATARGARAVRDDRRGFAHLHWRNWAPDGWFDEATFDRVAASWDNPDWVYVTLHSYRARWDEAEPDPRGAWLDEQVKATKTLSLPTLYVQGAEDGVNPPASTEHVPAKFGGPFEYVTVPGVGHFPQRERPQETAALLAAFVAGTRP
jgi:pimeloyl-ACP methyl ester carboxylesterase